MKAPIKEHDTGSCHAFINMYKCVLYEVTLSKRECLVPCVFAIKAMRFFLLNNGVFEKC